MKKAIRAKGCLALGRSGLFYGYSKNSVLKEFEQQIFLQLFSSCLQNCLTLEKSIKKYSKAQIKCKNGF